MSVYNFKTFQDNEIKSLKIAISQYKDYDKLDLIIEIIFNKKKKKEIKKREFKKKEKKEEQKTQKLPESLKYCDGDHCMVEIGPGC